MPFTYMNYVMVQQMCVCVVMYVSYTWKIQNLGQRPYGVV